MFGKGSLIIVFGFIMAFSVYQLKLNKAVLSTADNFNYYYSRTLAHENALSAMNYGINKVWAQSVNSDTFTVISDQCTSIVQIYESSLDTLVVKVNSWNYNYVNDYYQKHGKALKLSDSVFAYFSFNMPASRYFWFTNSEAGVYWITGDSVRGPIHTNGVFKTSGSPWFGGKISAKRGIAPNPTTNGCSAIFDGGWEVGIDNSVPTDMSHLITAANDGNGGAPMNTMCLYDQETTFEFLTNGDVIRTVGATAPDTVRVVDIAPTGAIHCTQDVRVKGVFNGQLTIYSADDIWIDDNIIYADDPLTNEDSNDILGLVAGNNVIMTNNSANNSDINIQACIMAVNGSFTASDYSGRPVAGTINLTGSVVQDRRGPVGTFSRWSNSITHGFQKNYHYDSRLSNLASPHYPFVRNLHLVSWWE